jgi:hypothetical protein
MGDSTMKKMAIISIFKLFKILSVSYSAIFVGNSTFIYLFREKIFFWEYSTIFCAWGNQEKSGSNWLQDLV